MIVSALMIHCISIFSFYYQFSIHRCSLVLLVSYDYYLFIFLWHRFLLVVTCVISQSPFLMIECSNDDNLSRIGCLSGSLALLPKQSIASLPYFTHVFCESTCYVSLPWLKYFTNHFLVFLIAHRTHSVPALEYVLFFVINYSHINLFNVDYNTMIVYECQFISTPISFIHQSNWNIKWKKNKTPKYLII